jgi:hypothetical protein
MTTGEAEAASMDRTGQTTKFTPEAGVTTTIALLFVAG